MSKTRNGYKTVSVPAGFIACPFCESLIGLRTGLVMNARTRSLVGPIVLACVGCDLVAPLDVLEIVDQRDTPMSKRNQPRKTGHRPTKKGKKRWS